MTGGGEFKSSLVQQMVWDDSNILSGLRPCAEEVEQGGCTKMPRLSSPSLLLPHDPQLLHLTSGLSPDQVGSTTTSPASLHGGGQEGHMPESWSQMLIGGLVGDDERYSTAVALLSKGLEEGPMAQAGAAYNFYGHGGGEEIQAAGTAKSQLISQMILASSARSCITTSLGGGMLDFSNGVAPASEPRNHRSAESNSTAPGSALKKARVQPSSSAQSTLKVRKERLGDRITALHQIVSPFGKTDTASVLQETIGYIRFLLGQIEALSYPYMGHGTASFMSQRDLLSNNATTQEGQSEQDITQDGEEGRNDLRSRGLCLVPVSCTSLLGADNATDI